MFKTLRMLALTLIATCSSASPLPGQTIFTSIQNSLNRAPKASSAILQNGPLCYLGCIYGHRILTEPHTGALGLGMIGAHFACQQKSWAQRIAALAVAYDFIVDGIKSFKSQPEYNLFGKIVLGQTHFSNHFGHSRGLMAKDSSYYDKFEGFLKLAIGGVILWHHGLYPNKNTPTKTYHFTKETLSSATLALLNYLG